MSITHITYFNITLMIMHVNHYTIAKKVEISKLYLPIKISLNIHYTTENNSPKLTRWKQIVSPLLNGIDGYIKTWRDDTTLNETTSEVYYNLASPMVINNLKFSNVTC